MGAVDLAAFAQSRAALAALVVTHPELTTPAAQDRAARWLATDFEVNMARQKLSDAEDDKTVQLGIKLPKSLLRALDIEVDRLRAQVPAELRAVVKVTINKSDVVRSILERALLPAPALPAATSVPADARQPDLFAARPAATSAPVAAPAAPVVGADLEARVFAAIERIADARSHMAHVPDLVRELPDLVPAVLHRALLALDYAGRIELRPWSGARALPESERAWCPPMDDGSPLAMVRLVAAPAASTAERLMLAGNVPALSNWGRAQAASRAQATAPAAAPAPDLRARFKAAAAADPKRVSNVAAARAIGSNDRRIGRWLKHETELSSEETAKLVAWLEGLGH